MRKVLVLIIITFYACNYQKKQQHAKIEYYYTNNYSNETDTVKGKLLLKQHTNDSLLNECDFKLNGHLHSIKMYTNDFHAPVDGGVLYYVLDSIGVIYSRSTTWYSYTRLRCNNDSLNLIIDAALENIILKSSLHCYDCNLILKKSIKFTPPVFDE